MALTKNSSGWRAWIVDLALGLYLAAILFAVLTRWKTGAAYIYAGF